MAIFVIVLTNQHFFNSQFVLLDSIDLEGLDRHPATILDLTIGPTGGRAGAHYSHARLVLITVF